MNNARHVDTVMDCFSEEFQRKHQLKTMVLWFQSESRFGDKLKIGTAPGPDHGKLHRVEAKDKDSGKTIFQTSLEWKSNTHSRISEP